MEITVDRDATPIGGLADSVVREGRVEAAGRVPAGTESQIPAVAAADARRKLHWRCLAAAV